MKKIFTLAAGVLLGIAAYAQTTTPNRIVVRDVMGQAHAHHINRVDSIFFATVEGSVAADVEIKNVTIKDAVKGTEDAVWLAITRTGDCSYYKISCMEKVKADRITTDEQAEFSFNYMADKTNYYQDFTNAQMSGFDFAFKPETEYTVVTLAYDQWGTACEMKKADFTTPKVELIGNPSVEYTAIKADKDSIIMSFSPNADVAGFAALLCKEGEAQEQLEMFGGWFGFSTIGEMVKGWGFQGKNTDTTFVWPSNEPGTNYEVLIQCWDANGTNADLITVPVTTDKLGGEGLAEVSITIGKFVKYHYPESPEYDEFAQYITFEPNENVALYHAAICTDSLYQADPEYVKEFILSDGDGIAYWDLYETDEDGWSLDLNTKYVAVAVGKNINDEWGPINYKSFTTPEEPDEIIEWGASYVAPKRAPQMKMDIQYGIAPRLGINAKSASTAGKLKSIKRINRGLQLIAR